MQQICSVSLADPSGKLCPAFKNKNRLEDFCQERLGFTGYR